MGDSSDAAQYVDRTMLKVSAAEIACGYSELETIAVRGVFEHHLVHIPSHRRPLFVFMGSTIGNYPADKRIELRLRAVVPQHVVIAGLDLTVEFAAGEELLTEVCCKCPPESTTAELAVTRLRRVRWWIDDAGDYGMALAVKDAGGPHL